MGDTLGLPSQRPAIVLAQDEGHPPHMITFEHADGNSESFSYLDLRSVRYDPAGLIRLRFAADNVVLHGRNLLSVWSALRSRRVRLLRIGGTEATTDPEPHIVTGHDHFGRCSHTISRRVSQIPCSNG
jgi:hypothetical protein